MWGASAGTWPQSVTPNPAAGTGADRKNAEGMAVAAPAEGAPYIVIGFVGGYVRHDNAVHSVVQVSNRLKKEYGPEVVVRVYENHRREAAHAAILELVSGQLGAAPTETQKAAARIILYGHSWGASEAVTLARELARDGIPVMLTIQVDSVRKRGEEDGIIPANVAAAANFYQSDGLLHGRAQIRAAEPERTKILENKHFGYKAHPLACKGYPWYDRVFMKAHTEIECDPAVWDQVEALIRARLPAKPDVAPAGGAQKTRFPGARE